MHQAPLWTERVCYNRHLLCLPISLSLRLVFIPYSSFKFFSCARLDPDNPDHSKSVKDESYNDGDDERGEDDYGASDDESDTNSGTEKDAEPKKPKRTRTAYSNSQLDQLELIFATTHYPDVFTREDLSRRLGIREDRIQVRWHDILSRRI